MAQKLEPCPNFIGGEWLESKTARTPVFNPSIGEVISECPVGNVADANAAVEAAHAAFPAWMETPPVERARILAGSKCCSKIILKKSSAATRASTAKRWPNRAAT
jgi:delta 1-pyrroline-5-carboxylate dehydrogenase